MGFLKRLLGREEEGPADSFGTPPPAASVSTPVVSFQSQPAEASWSTVVVNGTPLPPDQSQAFTAAFEQLGNLATLGSSQVVDLRHVPGLREQVLGAVRDHANDPAALQQAVFAALQEAAPHVPELKGSPGDPEGPIHRLRELAELRQQGALTDAEFDAQKKKLLREL